LSDIIDDPEVAAILLYEGWLAQHRVAGRPSYNSWVRVPPITAYLRRSRRYVPGTGLLEFVDIAAVCVEEAYQKKGYFTEFVSALLDLYNVHIECVHTEYLCAHLKKRKFLQFEYDPTCFYRLRNK